MIWFRGRADCRNYADWFRDLARTRPHVTQDDYFEIYSRHLELDRKKALHLSLYLHDLGVFLHFQQSRELLDRRRRNKRTI